MPRIGWWGPLNGFLHPLASLLSVFSLDPASGMPSFSVGIGEITRPEKTLDEIFTYLEKAVKPSIVAIDEFQKVADYKQKNVKALLRLRIQRLQNTVFSLLPADETADRAFIFARIDD